MYLEATIMYPDKWTLSLEKDKYQELSRNARSKIIENCSFEAVSRKYIELYSKILNLN